MKVPGVLFIHIALAYHAGGLDDTSNYAKESSKLTHPHSRPHGACSIYTQLVVNIPYRSGKITPAEVLVTSKAHDKPLRERLGVSVRA